MINIWASHVLAKRQEWKLQKILHALISKEIIVILPRVKQRSLGCQEQFKASMIK